MRKGINVLSTFNGMGCIWIALDKLGAKVNKRYSCEIDKYANIVNDANYPDTIQLGDVTKVKAEDLEKIDLFVGGSPCQGFSFAGKQLNFEDPRSMLFFEFVRLLKEIRVKNPNVFFLLENVKMKKEYQDVISDQLSVEPIEINSNLVSAQNRRRLYWTNVPNVAQPEDKNIFLQDVLDNEVPRDFFLKDNWLSWWKKNKEFQIKKKYSALNPEKAICMTARQYASWNGNFVTAPFVFTEKRTEEAKKIRRKAMKEEGRDFSPRRAKAMFPREDSKSNCLTAGYSLKEGTPLDVELKLRKLTPTECERLQTVPDNYTNHVSDSQRYKMLGNGWTVDVIAGILENMKEYF